MDLVDRILTFPQFIAPKRTLSQLVWKVSRSRNEKIKRFLISAFQSKYTVDLNEAATANVDDYDSFNDFFTRKLLPSSRPISPNADAIVCPADGTISQLGEIKGENLFQAKGRYYSLSALLAGDEHLVEKFTDGAFATIYLAPHNYHRVHSPVTGTVKTVSYVPGSLFSVNNRTARCVENLFARNERVIVELDSAAGSIAVIFVGAMLVSSIELNCCDLTHAAAQATKSPQPISVACRNDTVFDRGAELGRFNMGSTIILLTQPRSVAWETRLQHGDVVRVGESLGSLAESP
ncbi:MAG: phosphatidylserine decarboxylase [Gammaproteobacteria bacterium]|jgi:phosphatidylserine decarboxylase